MSERLLPRKEVAYSMPTEVIFGRGVLNTINREVIIARARKIVLVVGGHFRKSEAFNALREKLYSGGKEVIVYGDSIKTSNFDTVNDLTNFTRENQPDVVVAIGGGTIIDTAKCAVILARNLGRVEDYLIDGKKIMKEGVNFVAVPTTAGTGSEVTPWAVVWDYKNHEKYSLSSPLMFARLAIVDPSLTDELPPKITAETGMDALTQAIEAFWSKLHNPTSDKYALQAIRLIMENLTVAVNNPDKKSRDTMAKGSLFTGLAFSNTKTTICHSLSYPITIHWKVSHGQAVSVTLPKMIEYSLPFLEKERREMILSAIDVKTSEEAAEKIGVLMKSIGLATKLSELGITEKDLDIIVKEGYNSDRMNNAPRIPTKFELRKLLTSIL